ncbi:MAG: hypothetical protein IPQ08_14490 [Chitinophagaceae bacterium]|nr:hypothetical protein [Chitinophagaceae bacterium]
MEKFLIFWLFALPAICRAQSNDSMNPTSRNFRNNSKWSYKPEILTSGFIDFTSTGQVNASARLVRLFIGEPGGKGIPISIYSGVSSNSFQNQQIGGLRSNDQLGNNLINPLGGLVNMTMEGLLLINKKNYRITSTGLIYQIGARLLSGYRAGSLTDPSTGRPVNFLNSLGAGGFYFQTGAWEKNNSRNMGIFWLAGRYIFCNSGKEPLRAVFPNLLHHGLFQAWSAGGGIEINNFVNIKLLYYKYTRKPSADLSDSIYQFSFTYAMK